MDQFDQKSNGTHDEKSDAYCLRDFYEFTFVRLRATIDEESSVVDEVLRNIDELLELVCHLGCRLQSAV